MVQSAKTLGMPICPHAVPENGLSGHGPIIIVGPVPETALLGYGGGTHATAVPETAILGHGPIIIVGPVTEIGLLGHG